MLESEQESKIENRKEAMSHALESFLNYAVDKDREIKPDDIFTKVVESLKSKAVFLPNPKIINISTVYTSQGKYFYVVKFSNKVTLLFEMDNQDVAAKIDGKVHNLNDQECQTYREKYFDYLKLFLEERENLYGNLSVSEKLDSLEI